jgi:hypothetical protein
VAVEAKKQRVHQVEGGGELEADGMDGFIVDDLTEAFCY